VECRSSAAVAQMRRPLNPKSSAAGWKKAVSLQYYYTIFYITINSNIIFVFFETQSYYYLLLKPLICFRVECSNFVSDYGSIGSVFPCYYSSIQPSLVITYLDFNEVII
jgi:hypothetical protein